MKQKTIQIQNVKRKSKEAVLKPVTWFRGPLMPPPPPLYNYLRERTVVKNGPVEKKVLVKNNYIHVPTPVFITPRYYNNATKIIFDDSDLVNARKAIDFSIAQEKMNSAIDDLRFSVALTDISSERRRLSKAYKAMKLERARNYEVGQTVSDSSALIFAALKKVSETVESSILIDVKETEPVIASLGGTKFHKPNCDVVKRIPKEKRISFESNVDAEKHEYSSCNTCFPGENGVFYGSKEQNKVHIASCPSLRKVNEDNMVTFSSAKEAFDVGFAPCEFCMRHAKKKKVTKVQSVNNREEQSFSQAAVARC